MKDSLHSKKTYANVVNAEKACRAAGKKLVGTHVLPSGRVCYVFSVSLNKE